MRALHKNHNLFESCREGIENTDTIQEALFVFKKHLRHYGVRDISYMYQIRKNAYKRGDITIASTMSDTLAHIYWVNGGPNTDPVIRLTGKADKPTFIDLKKFTNNKFYAQICDDEFYSLWTIPAKNSDFIGFSTLTLFQEHRQNATKIDPILLQECGSFFHSIVLKYGHIRRRFKIKPKEIQTLARMADGKTANDIRQEFGVTQRTVELRLEKVRKKLRARTTTEAVYKALIYGILPYQD